MPSDWKCSCGKPLDPSARACPHCGRQFFLAVSPVQVAIAVVIWGLIVALFAWKGYLRF